MEKFIKYIQGLTEANLSVCENANTFLQSDMWGEFKTRFGWTAKAFLLELSEEENIITIPLLVLCRNLAPGFSFAYIPWGPQLPESYNSDTKLKTMTELAKKLKSRVTGNTVFIRFEPPWYNNDGLFLSSGEKDILLAAGFKQAAATVQAPDTVIINLSNPREEILAKMKPKWRYNITLAGKKNVQVKKSGSQELEIFYSLLKETAQRDGIAVHSIDYYKSLFELCENQSKDKLQLNLYTASHEGDILAAIVVIFRGKDAAYLYGASSNIKRNYMAPYALQWKAMQDAKEKGCIHYDLFGIPPNDDPNHPMAGLYRFKTGFGGVIVHRFGSWDFPLKPFTYVLYNIAEALRKKIRDLKKKSSR